ncbi:uncharacterized protein F4812DRAFT_183558 [Daldinia caldariorum]|uniref:uncharacterized protein n=1 Tax=Daldinia caldariorum TaxID=326644 RepID=UPI002008447A|nr:uncharacterized protein F4812DRAFT_183558 [Daldinia caldariorum]KAI1471551.1 hypothetical protein F4812DRAFT_183558 [Daldinia caldariorum]
MGLTIGTVGVVVYSSSVETSIFGLKDIKWLAVAGGRQEMRPRASIWCLCLCSINVSLSLIVLLYATIVGVLVSVSRSYELGFRTYDLAIHNGYVSPQFSSYLYPLSRSSSLDYSFYAVRDPCECEQRADDCSMGSDTTPFPQYFPPLSMLLAVTR